MCIRDSLRANVFLELSNIAQENVLTQNYFHEYINPEIDISLSAQKVHGISNEFLIGKPTFNKIVKKFSDKNEKLKFVTASLDKKIIELNGECFLNQILPLPSGVPVPAGWSPCSTLPR